MSRSVIIPIVSPFLPETSTQPMLYLAISFATSAAVSDSLAVMTGLVMMSRTIMAPGSVSCTDKAERPGVSASIKSSCELHSVFPAKRYQHDGSRPASSFVEYRVEPSCSDSEGGVHRPSASSLTRLLDSAWLVSTSWSYLQPCGFRLVGSGSGHAEHDHRWNRSLFYLYLSGEESSEIWARGAEGSEQARDDWYGVLHYLDDLHDDSTVYCSKPSSFLAGSFFSTVAGSVAEVGVAALFNEDRSVT